MTQNKKILVTCALPYANGEIHIGHMLEHIQADIWVRYQRMQGNNEVYFICADDAHGTAIMLRSYKLGITPEEIISNVKKEHQASFLNFNISYDNYYSTHSKENYELTKLIYKQLKKKKLVQKKIISQFYDTKNNMFLPDRFIKGICPSCNATNQYGDGCEICGNYYSADQLIHPHSALSNTTLIKKNSEHIFFELPAFESMLRSWIESGVLQESSLRKVREWFKKGLKKWNISRDAPYFGFEIPDESKKYFYVWMDAPIGYIATFKNLCNKRSNLNFNDWWNKNSQAKIYHFIGKDIVYFHSLFWPAVLEASDFLKPTKLFVHGHVTINGKKLSKSRGFSITASKWLRYFDSDCLRYYYASKLSSKIEDVDLNLEDFVQKVNSDIVNKVVNLASRSIGFISKYFDDNLSDSLENPKLYNVFTSESSCISDYLHNCEFRSAIKKIIYLVNIANQYFDTKCPWKLAKQYGSCTQLQQICSMAINLFRVLMTYLKPIMPSLASRSEEFLNIKLLWNEINDPLLSHKVKKFKLLYRRLDKANIYKVLKCCEKEK